MANSPHSSSVSAPCRLEWRPSRLLCGALILLGMAATASSQARREAARPSCVWIFPANGRVTVDGLPAHEPRLVWRGPLAVLHWRDRKGVRHRLGWWPDTLPGAARRELRLAAGIDGASRDRRPMAP